MKSIGFPLCAICAVLFLLTGCESEAERKLEAEGAAKKQWVLANVTVGMTKDEVIEKLGKPDVDDSGDAKFPSLSYVEMKSVSPFVNVKGGYDGCDVKLKDGKVTEVDIINLEVDSL